MSSATASPPSRDGRRGSPARSGFWCAGHSRRRQGSSRRPAAQLVDEVGDQIVEPAVFADDADQRLARNGFCRGEDRRFDSAASIPASGRLPAAPRVRRRGALALSPAAARCGAHRPYSRNAGRPVSSRAAPSASKRSNSRRAARSVIDAWRAASAAETQSSASSRSTILAAGLARSLGATAIRVFERRERSAARSRAAAAASAIAPAAAFGQAGSPGLGASPGAREAQGRIQDFRGDQRQGSRPAQPEGEDEVEDPKGEDLGLGRGGVREGGEGEGGGLRGRGERIALPCPSFKTGRQAVRVHSQVEPRRRGGEPAAPRLGGRLASSRHSRSRFAAGERSSPIAKRRSRRAAVSALRRRILAEAAALCSARRERSAPAAGGSRRGQASSSARLAPAQNSGSPSLPFRWPAPRPGPARPGRACAAPGVRTALRTRAPLCGRAATSSPGSTTGSETRWRSARITGAW